jgi:hypothetical protein
VFLESLLTPNDDLFDSDGHVNRLGASRTSGDRGVARGAPWDRMNQLFEGRKHLGGRGDGH